tara:strand:- start:79 stop:294 length:216 start_codon:yes stop_codon:yes gene_type:complete
MKTIKLELSVKLLLGAIALGLFLNAFNDFPPKAHADHGHRVMKVAICDYDSPSSCADVSSIYGLEVDRMDD